MNWCTKFFEPGGERSRTKVFHGIASCVALLYVQNSGERSRTMSFYLSEYHRIVRLCEASEAICKLYLKTVERISTDCFVPRNDE